jgi:hypothetical protein
MALSIFDDKSKLPTDSEIAKKLGLISIKTLN